MAFFFPNKSEDSEQSTTFLHSTVMATLSWNPPFFSSKSLIPKSIPLPLHRHLNPPASSSPPIYSSSTSSQSPNAIPRDRIHEMVNAFDPSIPLPEAATPPSSWYTDPSILALEYERVFFRGWQVAGFTEQVESPNNFLTGRLGNLEFVICRDGHGDLHAFHNVCRHHASLLASGMGKTSCFVCPYHGWTYDLDGTLLKATHITGIKNFNVMDFRLVPLKVAAWGPFILLRSDGEKSSCPGADDTGKEWLGTAANTMSMNGIDCSLKHVCRREYTIECNWKVFCDNYLDGGYHVPYAHGELASGLKLDSYSTMIFENVSIQRCDTGYSQEGNDFDRLGSKAFYAFVYPNFMINRYGPWMDTNLVIPRGPRQCQVIFDYFLQPSLMGDGDFIAKSLEGSERVQIEDIALCEGVQKGLESPAYDVGRYAPKIEAAMHHFHCLLHSSLVGRL